MSYKFIYLYIFFFFSSFSFANIKGIVIDAKSSQPIPSVNIVFSNKGTATDGLGKFNIEVFVGKNLEFSHVGYQSLYQKAEDGMIVRLMPKSVYVDEVIVYSGLNEESLQRLNHSVSVFTGNELKSSSQYHFQSLTNQIPNLNWVGGTSRPRYFQIRGIGERSHYFGEGAPNFSVGFILDDMELSGLGMIGDLFDLNQVEVFRGPMSSVFGSNSLAGLISLRSKDPTDNYEMESVFSRGTDNHMLLNNMLNLRLTDKLNLRLTGTYNYSNGFRRNLFKQINNSNKKEEQSFRVKLAYKPLKSLNILSTFIYADLDNGYDVWAPDNNEKYHTYADDIGEDSQQTSGGSIRLKLQLGNDINLTSITSSTRTNLVHSYDGDWANNDYWYGIHGFDPIIEGWEYKFYDKNEKERRNISQDIRISNNEMIFGAYYKNLVELDKANGYLFGGLGTNANSQYDFRVYSGYFKLDRKIHSRIKLSTSFRLEKNQIDYLGETRGLNDYWELVNLPSVRHSNSDLMSGYRGSLVFVKNNSMNFISSIAKGYKSGGVNQQPYINDSNRNYEPEALYTIEMGIKYKNSSIRTNTNLFYGFRQNQQVSISSQQIEGDPNSFIYYTSNAGSGTIFGIESENKIILNENTTITLSGSFLDTWVNDFDYFIEDGIQRTGGNREAAIAPRFSGSMNVYFESNWGLKTSVTTNYKSEYFYSDSHDNKSNAYYLTDVFFTKSIGKNFSVTFWGENIFNKKYSTRGFYFGLIPPEYPDQLFKSYADPRHLGISMTSKF